jgi:hypothetical protein
MRASNSAVTIAAKTEAKSAGRYLIGPNPEADERIGSEGVGDRYVGSVAAQSDQHAAYSRNVIARVKVYHRPPRYASNQPAKSIGP